MRPWRHNLCALRLVRCKTIDLFSTTSLESQESYLTTGKLPYKHSSELFSVLSHGSKTLPPRQPRVFARLAIMLPPRQTSPSARYDWSVGKTIDLLFPTSLESQTIDLLFPTALTSPSLRATIGPSAKQSSSESQTIDLLFPTSLESQESYLTTGMLPYKHSRSFPQYARFYNAAASPASRLRSDGLVGNNGVFLSGW